LVVSHSSSAVQTATYVAVPSSGVQRSTVPTGGAPSPQRGAHSGTLTAAYGGTSTVTRPSFIAWRALRRAIEPRGVGSSIMSHGSESYVGMPI
jgi:hypothetical protein